MDGNKKMRRNKLYMKLLVIIMVVLMTLGLGTKETSAVYISAKAFETDAGMFCLNRGDVLASGEYSRGINFTVKNGEDPEGEYFGPPADEAQYRSFIAGDTAFIYEHPHLVAYILSTITSPTRDARYVGDPRQIAMWLIRGNGYVNLVTKNHGSATADEFAEGATIAAYAKAYDEFIQKKDQVGHEPDIYLEEASVVGTKDGKEIVGPFRVEYPYASVTTAFTANVQGGRTESSPTGTYGEIVTMRFNNVNIAANEIYDASGNRLNDLFGGYAKSDTQFYLLVPSGTLDEEDDNDLEVTLNNGYRDAEYAIMSTDKAAMSGKYQNLLSGEGFRGDTYGKGTFKPAPGFKRSSQDGGVRLNPVMASRKTSAISSVNILKTEGRVNVNWDMGPYANLSPGGVTKAESRRGGALVTRVTDQDTTASTISVTWERWGTQIGTVTLYETTAPTGYKKIVGSMYVTITRYVKATGTETIYGTFSHVVHPSSCNHEPEDPDDYVCNGYNVYDYNWTENRDSGSISWNNWVLDPDKAEQNKKESVITARWKDTSVLAEEYNNQVIALSNTGASTNLKYTMYDIPVVTFGGSVWLDQADDGLKDNKAPDGIMGADEKKVDGVRVMLYKMALGRSTTNSKGTPVYSTTQDPYGGGYQVLTDLYGNDLTDIVTDSSGAYRFSRNMDSQIEGVVKASDYYIKFEYDGVNYDATTNQYVGSVATEPNSTKSHAMENGEERTAFNNKFKTISGGSSTSDSKYGNGNAGGISLQYREGKAANDRYQSTLITTETEESSLTVPRDMEDLLDPFKMHANTNASLILPGDNNDKFWDIWTNSDKNKRYMSINLGICERVLELSLKTDVDTALIKVNDKETTYEYDEIRATGGLLVDMNQNKNSYDVKKYNLNLYKSDYYYRITDYVTPGEGETQGIENQVNDVSIGEFNNTNNMEDIYVTYKMLLTNHTNHERVRVDTIFDYYDENYEYVENSIRYYGADGKTAVGRTLSAVPDGQRDIEVQKEYHTYNKLVISNLFGDNEWLGKNGARWIYLQFRVTPNPNQTNGDEYQPIHLQPGEAHPTEAGTIPEKPEYKNIVNIASYTTEEGFIDRKAAPSIVVEDDTNIHHTNHSDEAPGLVIQFNENDRVISGVVWEDAKTENDSGYMHGNGKYDEGEKTINDVIVQLIEIKDVKVGSETKQFEYIWQEAKSGSNRVQALRLNGEHITEYNVQEEYEIDNGDGGYTFKAYQPGKYIVRYIYGDGTRNDTNYTITDNVRTYNGNDYQSTIDPEFYKTENFSYANNDGVDRNSDARDNESRRLEVMSNTAFVDNALGVNLDAMTNKVFGNSDPKVQAGLTETWMCAETSKMDISFEDYQDFNDSGRYNEEAIDGNEKTTKPEHYVSTITRLDFGIQKRPENSLELQKHLVGLNITVEGVGPILDVRARDGLDKVADQSELDASYGKDDLMIIGTADRMNRGQWYFQTNTDELARGADLEATYKYTVYNRGEKDYLSKQVVDKYVTSTNDQAHIKNVYIPYLENASKLVKEAIKLNKHVSSTADSTYHTGSFLGQAYYTGNISTSGANSDAEVPSRAEEIEEALNNQLSFDIASEGDSGVSFRKYATEIDRVIYNTNAEIITQKINTVVHTKNTTNDLITGTGNNAKDNTKEIILTRGLNTTDVEDELLYDSYIAEIWTYSNAAGRRDVGDIDYTKPDGAIPGQLSHGNDTSVATDKTNIGAGYVHSSATEHSLTSSYDTPRKLQNEHDEFWAESIKITKPTGVTDEVQLDNNLNMAVIIGIPALIVLAGAIVLIVKFVIIKK